MTDTTDTPAGPLGGESPTTFAVDLWTGRRAERLAKSWTLPRNQTERNTLLQLEPVRKELAHVAADALDMLLATAPTPVDRPADMHRALWMLDALGSPDLARLRAQTMHHPDVALTAAIDIATAYADAKQQEQGGGDGGSGGGQSEKERKQSAGRAIRAAAQTAEDADAMKEALGFGVGREAGLETQIPARQLLDLARQMQRNDTVRRIALMAGRFIAKANRLRAERTETEGQEVTGLDLSGDVGRLVPTEAAMVAGVLPEVETLALLRLAQRRAMSYRRNAYANERGPVVVSVDESGSMQGDRFIAAKAIALAIAAIARKDGRPFVLVGWSSGQDGRYFRSTADAAADAPKLLDWATRFQGGGTNLDIPLCEVTSVGNWPVFPNKRGRADHIIITDDTGVAEVGRAEQYREWGKRKKVRTFGFSVGFRGEPKGMLEYCDGGAWSVPNLTIDAAGVDTVLTI